MGCNCLDEGAQHCRIAAASGANCTCTHQDITAYPHRADSPLARRAATFAIEHWCSFACRLWTTAEGRTCRECVKLVRNCGQARVSQPSHVVLVRRQEQAAQVLQAGLGTSTHRRLDVLQDSVCHRPL
jgi:hypothetical protein